MTNSVDPDHMLHSVVSDLGLHYLLKPICLNTLGKYEGRAKSFVTGFGLRQCYILSNIFLLQTFKVSPFTETHF